MKIAQIITGSASFGGAEAHVRDLSIGLSARGHQCFVLAGPPEGLLSEQLRASGIQLVVISALMKPMHPVWDIVSLIQVLIALRKVRPDIIATHTSKAGFVGRVVAKLLRIPCFFTPHGLSFVDRRDGGLIRFRLLLERIAARVGGKMIAVCEAERALASRHLGKWCEITTIHNGVPNRDLQVNRSQERVVITMIARFDVQKDHSTLFRALSTLTHLDWELRLAGSGPLLPDAQSLAAEYGLSSRIWFMNQCPDTPGLLSQSDIFALITNWEAFPISILEAMRSALPVVATDIGGVNEAIENDVNGFLVPRADASRLADSLASLIQSSDLRARMGSSSRRLFLERFDSSLMLDKTEAIYTSALSKRTWRTQRAAAFQLLASSKIVHGASSVPRRYLMKESEVPEFLAEEPEAIGSDPSGTAHALRQPVVAQMIGATTELQ
jgi:glycosyltransferase involved in cell wall biosynthesis